jgi:hypothetical protein
MLDILTQLGISAISALFGSIATLAVIKYSLKPSKLYDSAYEILTQMTQDADMQKKLYGIGALIGAGAKTGLGFQGKGGKMKLEDLLINVGLQFLPSILKKVGLDAGEQPQQLEQQQGASVFG